MAVGPLLGMLGRWWWLVLLGAVLGAGAALIAVNSMPPIYRATSTLFVISPNDAALNQSFARTYAQMAVHAVVLERVREMLALSSSRLEGTVTAHPIPDTQLVEIVVQAGDAALAREIANATARAFIEQQANALPAGPAGPSLRMGQPAITPEQPTGPRPLPALLLGLLVGVLVGLGVAGLLDMPRAVPVPFEVTLAHRPVPGTIRPTSAVRPSVSEPVGTSDVLRGLIVVAVAGAVLLVPLAVMVGLRPGGERPGSEPSQSASTTSSAPPVAQAPALLPIAQIPVVTDLPAGPSAVSPATEVVAPDLGAEIAGATSAAAPEPSRDTDGGPMADPAVAQPAVAVPPGAAALSAAPTRALFEDRFEAGPRLWPNDPRGPAWYEGGGYRLFARQPGQFVAVAAPFRQPVRDAIVTAAFQKIGGPTGGVYGLIVRDAGPSPRDGTNQVGDFYVLGVDDGGRYGVWRREVDRWVDLVSLTRSEAVRGGAEPNEITVLAIDDRLTLTVNGEEVATVIGAQAQFGAVGVYVGGDFNQVMLNRFQVLTPTSSAPSAPQATSAADVTAPVDTEVAGAVGPSEPEVRAGTIQAPEGFAGAFLREGPTTTARALGSLANGTPIEILPDTASGDGFTWLRVGAPDGVLGWVVSTAIGSLTR